MACIDIFAERLTELRERTKTTQQDLANALGISRQALSAYEKSQRRPDIETLAKIADYFNTMADYLLGRSDVKTTDMNITAICKSTHLTEKAVNMLCSLTDADDDIALIVIFLLEQYSDSQEQKIFGGGHNDDIGAYFFYEYENILTVLSKYLRVTPQEGVDRLYISESGRIINAMSTDRNEINSKTHFKDIIQVDEIDTGAIINRVLLDNLENSLKYSKKEYPLFLTTKKKAGD